MKKRYIALSLFSSLAFLAAVFIYSSLKWLDANFGYDLTFDSIIFTITSPVDDSDPRLMHSYIDCLAAVLGAFAIFNAVVYQLYRRKKYLAIKLLTLASTVSLCLSIVHLENRYHVIDYFFDSREVGTFYEENYVFVKPEEVVFPENKNNLIFIMLESVENTFNDRKLFLKPLMPKLKNLQNKNFSFNGHAHTRRGDWTVAGLVNYLFGVPLSTPLPQNMDIFSQFLPGAVSLIEIFEHHGYDVEFIQGGSASFAGQDKIFNSHMRNGKVYDLSYFEKLHADGSLPIHSWAWGVADRDLYWWLKNHLSEKDPGKPFVTIIQTINTHQPGTFEGLIKPQYNDFRDCIVEADFMADDFIKWLRKQKFAKNTTIILVGDHMAMTDAIGAVKLPEHRKREIFNLFINPAIKTKGVKRKRHYASFDMAPTILEAMGAQLPERRLGLGVSLFDPKAQTIFESKGVDYYEGEVAKQSKLYESFYSK